MTCIQCSGHVFTCVVNYFQTGIELSKVLKIEMKQSSCLVSFRYEDRLVIVCACVCEFRSNNSKNYSLKNQ